MFQDAHLLTSISATERVKLWDKFTGPVDQDAIKMEFFRKIHRQNPPFRIKVKMPPRHRVLVPPMVKYHYKYPVDLLPSLRDVIRYDTVVNQLSQTEYIDDDAHVESSEDVDVVEKSVVDDISLIKDIKVEVDDDIESIAKQNDACSKINGVFEMTSEGKKFLENILSNGDNTLRDDDSGIENIAKTEISDDVRYDEENNCINTTPCDTIKEEVDSGSAIENNMDTTFQLTKSSKKYKGKRNKKLKIENTMNICSKKTVDIENRVDSSIPQKTADLEIHLNETCFENGILENELENSLQIQNGVYGTNFIKKEETFSVMPSSNVSEEGNVYYFKFTNTYFISINKRRYFFGLKVLNEIQIINDK